MNQLLNLPRKWLNISIISLLILSTWIILQSAPTKDKAVSQPKRTPDFIIENATHIQMNKQGKPKFKLQVASAIHYPDNSSSRMISPKLTTLQPGEQWYIESGYGKAFDNTEQNKVVLQDNVTVKKINEKLPNHSPTLKTSELTLWPDKSIAETVQPVTINQGKHQLEATGLYADLKLKQMELHSEVKGYYETAKQNAQN